jgi:alcohol dehydrogenase (cytochrome c)
VTATRNGYFYVVDRITGEHLVTGKFSPTVNWAKAPGEELKPWCSGGPAEEMAS